MFRHSDPLGEYRWVDVPRTFHDAAETVWAYGGAELTPTDQLLTPHWKICAGIERRWDADGARVIACHPVLLGPVSIPRRNSNPRGYEMIAVRLNPERASLVVDIAPRDLLDTDVSSPDLPLFHAALRLAEKGAAARDVGRALLHGIMTSASPPRRAVDEAAAIIRKRNGLVRMAELESETGLGIRTLRRFFEAELGISPKTYCRSVRLKSLLIFTDQMEDPRWSDMALRFGYADQSHMCGDFQQLTGTTPTELHQRRRHGVGRSQAPKT